MNNHSSNWSRSHSDKQMSNIDSSGERTKISKIGSDDINNPSTNVSRVGEYTNLVKTGWGVTIEQISYVGSSSATPTGIGILMFGDTGGVG